MKRLSKHFLILSLFFLGACKDHEPLRFIISGQVYDNSFNQLMTTGELKLYKLPVGSTQLQFIESLTLVNGTYEFSFLRDKSEKYVLRFSNPGYFEEEIEVNFSDLTVGETYQLDFEVDAIAYVHWVFQNTNLANPNNSVSLQKLNGRTNGSGTCPNQTYSFSGQQSPDTLSCAVSGNAFQKFYIIDLPNYTLDSVYCEAQSDSYYFVYY